MLSPHRRISGGDESIKVIYIKGAMSCELLRLNPFTLTFSITSTNSSSSPFFNFCQVLYFWPSYLFSLNIILAILALLYSEILTACFRLLPFPSHSQNDDSWNKIRTLPSLSTQERVYLSMEECPPPSLSPREHSQLVRNKKSPFSDHCSARGWLVQMQTSNILASPLMFAAMNHKLGCVTHQNERTFCYVPKSTH